MQVVINILIKISQYLVPVLINFVDKHKDEYLQKLSDKILKKLEGQGEEKMSTLRVQTNIGALVEFNLGRKGIVKRVAEDGSAVVAGLDEEDRVTITVMLDGYKTTEKVIESMNMDKEVVIELVKNKEIEQVAIETVANVTPAIVDIVKKIDITDITNAKEVYKDITNTIKENQDIVEDALKKGSYDVVQTAGTVVINTARQQLTDSIAYYVDLRSKLNPLGSWVEFRDYTEYTSMIAGLYLLRANLVKWFDKVLVQLEKL